MTHCLRCKKLLRKDEIFMCDECTVTHAPASLLKVREYYEMYLDSPEKADLNDGMSLCRMTSRVTCDDIAERCWENPNKHLFMILTSYIADQYTLEGNYTDDKDDNEKMLRILETSIGTAEDIITYIGGKQ